MKTTERLKRLVRMQNMTYDLDRALEINSLSLSHARDLENLQDHPGWKILSVQMNKDIDNKVLKILSLTIDPVKNEHQIIFHRAVYETLKKIVNLVEQTSTKTVPLRKERDQLMQQKEAVNA